MSNVISIGSQVMLADLDDGTHESHVLVSPTESDPAHGRLSNESPVGRAIEGHSNGDVVEVHVPQGVRHLRILTPDVAKRAA